MTDRRLFFLSAPLGLACALPCLALASENMKLEEEVGATEDLMREHGVLNRVLLVYEEGIHRLRSKEKVPPELFRATASLVRKFVEDYHEKLEENFIFPAFEKKKTLTDLVKVLKKQHAAGRNLTDVILREAADDRFNKDDGLQAVVEACEAFIRMYRPHEAHEDTVLFPTLRKVLTSKDIKDLGEQFEKEEDKLFGEGGFEKVVEQVAGFEKQLGIFDLDTFTPKRSAK
ncbi:MAG: hemerythrin domain-containing protein [Gemmataceae bacterium]